MIVDERLVTYINSLDTGNTRILDAVEREALDSYVPIIRKEMQSFLKLLLAMTKPKRILEVGTAVGFSSILMAEYDPVPCEIVTIENYEKRIPIARENFKRAGKEEQITLLEGDAAEILPTLTEPFDLIFMDIYLNELNGINIVRKIRQMDSKVMIVFLTTSKEHIFEAAPFHFFDYILKPFESTQIFHVLDDALALLPEQESELSFEYRSFDVHFPLSKIQYIYSNNHEVIIHTTNGTHAFRLPFYSVTDHLDDSRFLQCNRGIMLNMDYIKTMESDYFEMTDSKCFPIKTKGRKQIREQYIKYQFLKLEEA